MIDFLAGLWWWARFLRHFIPAAAKYHSGRLYYWRDAPTWVLRVMEYQDDVPGDMTNMRGEALRELALRKD